MGRLTVIKAAAVAATIDEGVAHHRVGRFAEAEAAYKRVLAVQPDNADALHLLGVIAHQLGRCDRAVELIGKAIAVRPDVADYHNNLGAALNVQGRLDEAAAALARAIELEPGDVAAHNNLGNTLKQQGRLDEAVACYRSAVELDPGFAHAYSNLLSCLHYQPNCDARAIFEEHRKWNAQLAAPLSKEPQHHANSPDPDRRLRIGLFSHGFRRHPVGYFAVSVFEAHDRDAVGLHCYTNSVLCDDFTERITNASDSWQSIVGMSDEDVAALVRRDAIDILVDLSGHFEGSRLLVFARRPAPVQVKWVGGQFNPTGMDTIGYFISDPVATPPGADALYSEEVVRLPDGYVCYEPPDYAPAVGPLPALSRSHVTFSCFNNLSKVNDGTIELWSRILRRIDGSRLVLKSKQFNDDAMQSRYRAMFEAHGIAPERLDLFGHSPHAELLAMYNGIDVALDPFPYSGGLTTCEALWMGVPVVTMPGPTFAGRHSATHLCNVGLDDWVVNSPESYVAQVERWCGDLEGLAGLRAGLRQRMIESPLCDAPRFARNLEDAYRKMWRTWCEAEAGRSRYEPPG